MRTLNQAVLLLSGTAVALALGACRTEDVELVRDFRRQVTRPEDRPSSEAELPRDDFCAGAGPAFSVALDDDAGGCAASLASRVFQYALCSCGGATFTAAFTSDAFDSARGPDALGQGGSVGVVGPFVATAPVEIGGSLIAAAPGQLPITAGPFRVAGNLMTNAGVVVTAPGTSVGRDLWVNGELWALGGAEVAGDLYQPSGSSGANGATVGGQLLTRDFTVAAPCACGEDELDIDAIVDEGLSHNHDREFGLHADALNALAPGAALDLDCGRFALNASLTAGDVRLRVQGRSALFIDGDLLLAGSLDVELGVAGELDLFIRGDLTLPPGARFGSVARPAALRVYVGGPGVAGLFDTTAFGANLYAPRASLVSTAEQTLHGALFVGAFQGIAAQHIRYDSAVQRTRGDASCGDPTPAGGCQMDAECGAALFCSGGRCTPQLD